MSITKRRVAIALAAVLVLAVITSVFSMTSIADGTGRSDYSVKFNEGGYIHADIFSGYDKVYIVDVSSYQTSIDWDKVYAAGIDGAILRVGYTGYKYGTYNADSTFQKYYNEAKAAGLKVGAYYFGQPTSEDDAVTEANYVLGLLSGRTFELPIAYDLEYATNSSGITGRLYEANFTSRELTQVANKFCDKIKSAGYEAMVYVNCSLLTCNMIQSLLNYPVWLARYNSYVDYNCTYTMWQFSCTSYIDGISTRCDVSVLYSPKSAAADDTTQSTTSYSGTTKNSSTTGSTVTTATTKSTYSVTDINTTSPSLVVVTDTGTTSSVLTATTQAATTVTADESTTAGSTETTDYFTTFLDFLLKILEYAATYIPKIISLLTSMAA